MYNESNNGHTSLYCTGWFNCTVILDLIGSKAMCTTFECGIILQTFDKPDVFFSVFVQLFRGDGKGVVAFEHTAVNRFQVAA